MEAIAGWLRRPLLALTVADIGTVKTKIESELIKWFSLAEGWNAVLLVDEADYFPEKRQNRDLARNGLVSGKHLPFRTSDAGGNRRSIGSLPGRMEYFKGLLFLTTNRVGHIDDAFISRIHIAIGYKTFSSEDRGKVWNGFLRELARDRAGKIQVLVAAKIWVLGMAVTSATLCRPQSRLPKQRLTFSAC